MKEDKRILLIHKILTGEATPDEQENYLNWLQEDEENLHFDEQIKTIWEKSKEIKKDEFKFDKGKLKSKIFKQINTSQNSVSEDSRRKPGIFRLNGLTSIAAMFLLVLAVVFVVNNYFAYSDFNKEIKLSYIQLPDHSSVWIDENSSVRVLSGFNKKNRKVYLKGSGYFEITPDKSNPFTVYVDKSKIQVVGTSFQVNSKKGENVLVNVYTGKVKFYGNQDKYIILEKDQGAEYDYKSNSFTKILKGNFDKDFKYQYLSFKDSYLTGVFARLSEFYKIDIELDCYDIRNMTGYTSPVNYGNTLEDYFSSIMKLYPVVIKKVNEKSYIVTCKK